jgi:transcriptional regulator with XRE-family HTH domain
VADIEPFYKELGKRIHAARVRAGLTQQDVAERLSPPVTRASVANMESGKQRILCHSLVALSEVLLTTPEALLLPGGTRATGPDAPQAKEAPMKEIEMELTRKLGKRATTGILTKLDGERS